jgi:hypothetical protein
MTLFLFGVWVTDYWERFAFSDIKTPSFLSLPSTIPNCIFRSCRQSVAFWLEFWGVALQRIFDSQLVHKNEATDILSID